MPALMLLPIWLASEYLQWRFATGETNVAYWVHIGGLVAGALIGARAPSRAIRGESSACSTPEFR